MGYRQPLPAVARRTVCALGVGLLIGTPAIQAAPIPLEPLAVPVAGESDLFSVISGFESNNINVDWMVIESGGGPLPAGFLYMYQLENTTGVGADVFSITLSPGTAATILDLGVLAADDLDLATGFHPSHTVGTFPILATEEEPFPLASVTGLITELNPADDTITWIFDPIPLDAQTDTLYFVSTEPPTYGNAVAQDSIPPSPWTTLSPGADMVPIPVPEPVSVLLLALGGVSALFGKRWVSRGT